MEDCVFCKIKYLILALLAFAGLGLEVLLAFVLEPVLYKRTNVVQSQKFSEKITQLMNA